MIVDVVLFPFKQPNASLVCPDQTLHAHLTHWEKGVGSGGARRKGKGLEKGAGVFLFKFLFTGANEPQWPYVWRVHGVGGGRRYRVEANDCKLAVGESVRQCATALIYKQGLGSFYKL